MTDTSHLDWVWLRWCLCFCERTRAASPSCFRSAHVWSWRDTHMGTRRSTHTRADLCVFKNAYANQPLKGSGACMALLLSLLCVKSDQFNPQQQTGSSPRAIFQPKCILKSTACTVWTKPPSWCAHWAEIGVDGRKEWEEGACLKRWY